MILYKLANHCSVVVCCVGSGITNLALVFRIEQIFEGSRCVGSAHEALIVDDPDRRVAINRPDLRVDDFLRKRFCGGRKIFGEESFFFHDVNGAAVVDHHIENRLAGAQLGKRAVHHLGRRSTPVFHGQSGPLPERVNNRFYGVGFEGAVGNNRTGFFLRGFEQFRVLRHRGK
jgi:hypothetical protein